MPEDEKIKIKASRAKIKAARQAKKTGRDGSGGSNGKKKGGALKNSKQFKWTRKEFKQQIAEQVATALSKQSGDDGNDDGKELPIKMVTVMVIR